VTNSAPGRIRTSDLALRRRALYPLSYGRGEEWSVASPLVDLTARIGTITTREPFVIARGTEEENEVLWVEIHCEGVVGRGEAAPIPRYEESAHSALAYAEEAAGELGDDPFAIEAIMGRLPAREFAARAAIDGALHDLMGKLLGRPVYQLIGLSRVGPPTSWTIWLGEPDDMARRAEAVRGRFKRLKLKLGGRDGRDVERVRAVNAVADVPLQVDVNEAWSLDEALDALPQLAELGVEYCEQPLAAGDDAGARVKARSPIPIYVDEDCHTLADVAACAERAHGINVKLAKSGGIREAVRMVHAARALDLGCMLGCMIESGLGIAAGAAVASLFEHVDLDGNILLGHDPFPGVQLVDGVQLPAELPGLGVSPA
jgi:L-alanine-DL-glutamate epimerase-like enolase superfamily enzyme